MTLGFTSARVVPLRSFSSVEKSVNAASGVSFHLDSGETLTYLCMGGGVEADRFIIVVETILDLLLEENALARGAVVAPSPVSHARTSFGE